MSQRHESAIMPDARTLINRFLDCRRIALVGVSRDPHDFTRRLWNEFVPSGAIPVHPFQGEIDGVACFPRVRAIDPPPEAVLILVRPDRTLSVLEDCHSSGVGLVWIYGVTGPKGVSGDVIRWCAERKIDLIAGYCPFMFLPGMAWPHRLHGAVAKFLGHAPGAKQVSSPA